MSKNGCHIFNIKRCMLLFQHPLLKYIQIQIILLLSLNSNTFSQVNIESYNINSPMDSVLNNQNTNLSDSGDVLLFQKFKLHLGVEVTNLVHIGVGFRVSDITMLELNIAAPLFFPVIGAASVGTNIQLFEDKKWILNVQIPFWLSLNANESLYMFPSLNIGWFTSWEKNRHFENIMFRGGISYLGEYHYNSKELRPNFLFFNLGVQVGWGFGK